MKPSRELDALIFEKVMGFNVQDLLNEMKAQTANQTGYSSYSVHIPAYSTDISAAWEVVEKIKEMKVKSKYSSECDTFFLNFTQGAGVPWSAGFSYDVEYEGPIEVFICCSISAPHAICLAALKALGVSIPAQES